MNRITDITPPEPENDQEVALSISKDEINSLPIERYQGKVHLVTSRRQVKPAVRRLKQESILGFDTETRPSFRKGDSYLPSLVQLAGEKAVYIFHLECIGFPDELKEILSTPDIVKVGVALDYDVKKLRQLSDFEPGGFKGMEPLAREVGIRNQGLRGLAAIALGIRIAKGAQCSNWSRKELSKSQIDYAATDAWVSREIYLALQRRRTQETVGSDTLEKASVSG